MVVETKLVYRGSDCHQRNEWVDFPTFYGGGSLSNVS